MHLYIYTKYNNELFYSSLNKNINIMSYSQGEPSEQKPDISEANQHPICRNQIYIKVTFPTVQKKGKRGDAKACTMKNSFMLGRTNIQL
jgi:hypothetical protein